MLIGTLEIEILRLLLLLLLFPLCQTIFTWLLTFALTGGHTESVKLSGHHELHLFHC